MPLETGARNEKGGSCDDVFASAERSRGVETAKTRREQQSTKLCEAVIDIAAAMFSVPGEALRKDGRTTRRVARVRQIAMYAAHTVLGLSQKEVGRAFGRDRTTVLHACHTVEDLRDEEDFEQVILLFETVVMAAFRVQAEGPLR